MLTIQDLRVQYDKDFDVLKGITLSLRTGEIHGFVGLNGAGKTTLLNVLYGFVTKQSGEIHFRGKPLNRKDIAYLEAENFFYPYMTGKEYLELFPTGSSGFSMKEWQNLFSLPLNGVIESYSTGMRKRLALLAVIKQDKSLLLFDEPFNGLDLEATYLLQLILSRLRSQGKTILITSHIYETLTECCDDIHYLLNGLVESAFLKSEFPLLKKHLNEIIEEQALSQIEKLL